MGKPVFLLCFYLPRRLFARLLLYVFFSGNAQAQPDSLMDSDTHADSVLIQMQFYASAIPKMYPPEHSFLLRAVQRPAKKLTGPVLAPCWVGLPKAGHTDFNLAIQAGTHIPNKLWRDRLITGSALYFTPLPGRKVIKVGFLR